MAQIATALVLLVVCFAGCSVAERARPSIDDLIPIGPTNRASLRSTYYLSKETVKRDWSGAIAFCNTLGMKLVSIEDPSEDVQILALLSGVDQAWTSGNDLAEENSFEWQGTGLPLVYAHWDYFDQAQLATGFCGAIFIGGSTCNQSCNKAWGKAQISEVKRFICEK